ncbi:ankyrin repeat and LEM domain-containing protein 1 isoform X2 [Melanotaenia boesemani]|uniref:ankyrin repeat and LEM domain-containing protein 1 isoform X2 n=1 Tax=Melanotaenia boesemani TaxID=1250792 RepID=UPI001C03C1DA|nr:ankyrin repeat and LEM domain-containing protein 1 isoform X2 [Melanotaenia boesemani]
MIICKQIAMTMDRNKKRLASQLCAAVNDEDPRSVQLLLSKGASPDVVGSKGVAAIHLAVGKETEKNIRCLKMLLQHRADPNIRSSEGLTPLHVAALWGCYQNLKLLLMNGGNPNTEDNEGNTPRQLAEQQDNRKCAHLLEEYQASFTDAEEDEFPKFQYSVYSDQTDTSSYPESDYSFTSQSSMISDFGEAPLSSTRRSSLFNLSNNNGRPNCRGISFNRLSGPSFLSSTRVSAVEPAATLSVLKEDVLSTDEGIFTTKSNEQPPAAEGPIFSSRQDALPAFCSKQGQQKSVSFRDVDEFFPVFSPESPKQHLADESSQGTSSLPFNMSDYFDFLDSERMATILPKQGIDVTSPDHVYVFCRESSESTEEDLEKTVVGHYALEVNNDELEEQNVKKPQVDVPEWRAHSCVGSSSSGTTSSHYSSCESDHYTSALDVSTHSGLLIRPVVDNVSAGTESNEKTQVSVDSDNKYTKQGANRPPLQEEPEIGPKPEAIEPLPAMLDKLNLSEAKDPKNDVLKACGGPDSDTSSKAERVADIRSGATGTLEKNGELIFTPSPFVTGRTRSRLSRCSLRTSRTPESLLAMSSLFEDTLPTPVRSHRQTPRTQSSGHCFNSPQAPCYTPSYSGSSNGDSVVVDSQDTQTSTLGAASSVSNSQADTLILSKSLSDSAGETQSFSDTVVLEKNEDNSFNAYERNLAEIILAIQQKRDETGGYLTDDLTSTDDASTKREVNDASAKDELGSLKTDDVWITEDCSSQSDFASSSSTSSYFSPKRSRDSDLPCTPGTGCTPRYSVSRLSVGRRPQRLADLSYTPGGRPLIQELNEPVEYLYTDTEGGHKLIETHVPPTADTSLSSGLSNTSSEETILYDWRCLQTEMKHNKEKENQQSQMVVQKERNGDSEDSLLPETRGMTDKELRLRLVELGESPGPISSRTRPTYMRRLCRLLQESQSQHNHKQLEQPQTGLGYSPELCCVLQTFKLPDCQADEQALCQQFDQPDQNRKWREGIIKSSFNYLLLDPRVTNNLPFRSHTMTPHECFQTFIHAIFYVGKGKRSRPYSHLYEALEYYKGDKTAKKLCPKVQHILQVWNAGLGVVSLHCFQNVIPVEAYTREACMVEAIGLKMLTNQKRGDCYGVVSSWQQKRKRELGIHLLYRAMQIFLAEGERQLRPADIRQ